MTQLGSLLKTDLVCSQFDAVSKKSLIEQLSLLFSPYTNTPTDQIFDAFFDREKLGSTAIGQGVAIPHIRTTLFIKPLLAVLILKTPIDFDADDQRPVDIIFALIAIENDNDDHLNLLSECSRLLTQQENRQTLRQSQTDDELISQLHKMILSIEHR